MYTQASNEDTIIRSKAQINTGRYVNNDMLRMKQNYFTDTQKKK